MLRTVAITVSGKVQGVFYRQGTKEMAGILDIKGWVKNMPDQTVGIVATGNANHIERFIEWCKKGPPRAMVTGIIIDDLPLTSFDKFTIVR